MGLGLSRAFGSRGDHRSWEHSSGWPGLTPQTAIRPGVTEQSHVTLNEKP